VAFGLFPEASDKKPFCCEEISELKEIASSLSIAAQVSKQIPNFQTNEVCTAA
jgi:hypothetical protein